MKLANATKTTAATTTAATTTPTTTTTTTTTPTTTTAVTGNTYQGLSATSTPANVAQAYETFVSGSGGDTPENQQVAINYLKDIGLSDEQINQAYNVYVAEAASTPLTTSTGGGMLSGGNVGGGGSSMTGTVAAAAEPSYTTLGASSSPQAIAAAYADFVASAGGDTAANQQVAIDYLTSLGVSQDTIGKAYGLFKGA